MQRLLIALLLPAFCSLTASAASDEAFRRLVGACEENPIDATWLITNPSFETGDISGWTVSCNDAPFLENDPEVAARRDYTMSGKEGDWLFNAYRWWAASLSIGQDIAEVPSGEYRLTATVCTWEGRNVYLAANGATASATGQGDQTGIRVSLSLSVGLDGVLKIEAGSNAQWWIGGHEGETQTFFKLDDLRLTCTRLFDTRQLGSFTAAALNVDGLPETILGVIKVNEGGPGSDGTKLISRYLAEKAYDIIGVSEDFNYHGSLMTALSSNYACGTHRGSISLSDFSYPFDTDGLNLLWKLSAASATNESWTRWTSTTSTDGNQYVKKGFRHYDVYVCGGQAIDVYVLHMDAGDAISSREAQWRQLADAINSANASRPKLVIGDTNSRWTREDIRTNFCQRLTLYDVADPWALLWRNGVTPTTDMADLTDETDVADLSRYEVVDKILLINPIADGLKLYPASFRIEQDYTYGHVNGTDESKWLGDHRPVVVDIRLADVHEVTTVVGDVNRDGDITIADVTALVNIILGKDDAEPHAYDHRAADTYRDGDITIADVTALVNIILDK